MSSADPDGKKEETYKAPDNWENVGPPPTEELFPLPQRTTRGANKRRAKDSPTIISSGEETVVPNKEKRPTKKLNKRKKRVNRITDEDDECGELSRTTSMETIDSVRTDLSLRREGGTTPINPGSSVKEHVALASSDLAKQAFAWLEELDEMRAKSGNIQGKVSGTIKKKIAHVREVVATLMGRADACGDTAFLKMRNAELSVQLRLYDP